MDESGQRDVGIRWEELNSRYARAANSFVQFAAAAQDAQIKSFQSGRRHALEELRRWILEGQQRSEVTEEDIVTYIKNELGYEEVGPVGVLSQSQHPSSDANMQIHAPYVSMPGGEQPTNNVMFPATPPSALTETPYPLGNLPGVSYCNNDSQNQHGTNNEAGPSFSYTALLFSEDVDLDMHLGNPPR